jgi:hypothetical protein
MLVSEGVIGIDLYVFSSNVDVRGSRPQAYRSPERPSMRFAVRPGRWNAAKSASRCPIMLRTIRNSDGVT